MWSQAEQPQPNSHLKPCLECLPAAAVDSVELKGEKSAIAQETKEWFERHYSPVMFYLLLSLAFVSGRSSERCCRARSTHPFSSGSAAGQILVRTLTAGVRSHFTHFPFGRVARVEVGLPEHPHWHFSLHNEFMGSARFLPLQVAAVCYRKCGASVEFLLVNTTSGDRWIFPKGATARRLSHSQAAEREALEEAGAIGAIEPEHFHLYLQPKGDSKVRHRIEEFVVKAFLLQVSHTQAPQEQDRNPTWFSADDARRALAVGREAKYATELRTVIDRAVERLSAQEEIVPDAGGARTHRIWRFLRRLLRVDVL